MNNKKASYEVPPHEVVPSTTSLITCVELRCQSDRTAQRHRFAKGPLVSAGILVVCEEYLFGILCLPTLPFMLPHPFMRSAFVLQAISAGCLVPLLDFNAITQVQ